MQRPSRPVFQNCTFDETRAGKGGAFFIKTSGPNLTNCTSARNRAIFTAQPGSSLADGVYNLGGVGDFFRDCLFTENSSDLYVGAMWNENSILWGNPDLGGSGESSQIRGMGSTLTVGYSCLQGWTGSLEAKGNTGLNPAFIDADGLDNAVGTADDNLRLAVSSPITNRGDNLALLADGAHLDLDEDRNEPVPLDLDRHVRPAVLPRSLRALPAVMRLSRASADSAVVARVECCGSGC